MSDENANQPDDAAVHDVTVDVEDLPPVEALPESARGTGGFGSTGYARTSQGAP